MYKILEELDSKEEFESAILNKEVIYFMDENKEINFFMHREMFTFDTEPSPAQTSMTIHQIGSVLIPFVGPYRMQVLKQTKEGLEVYSLDHHVLLPIYMKLKPLCYSIKDKYQNSETQFHVWVKTFLQMLITIQSVSDAENSRLAHKIATHISRNPKYSVNREGLLWNTLLNRISFEIKNIPRQILKGLTSFNISFDVSDSSTIPASILDNLSTEDAELFIGNITWFNERAASYAEQHFGSEGKPLAQYIRMITTEDSFNFWISRQGDSPFEPWLIAIARAILVGELQEMRERLERKPGPSVPHPLAEKYALITQRGNSIGNRDGALTLFNANKEPLFGLIDPLNGAPLQNATSIIEILEDGARLLNSVYAIKILLTIVKKVWEQWVEGNNHIINVIVIHGGWSGFCKWLGAVDKTTGKVLPKARKEIKQIMEIFKHGDFHVPSLNSKGPLLTFREPINPEDKRQKDLVITVNDPLLPDSVDALQGKTHTARASRRLVPFPPLPSAPDKLSTDKHGAHARLYLRTLIMLRERASQFAKHGWVKITDEDWCRVASASGLQQSDLKTVLNHWIETVGWLQQEKEDQYCIATNTCYSFAQKMLIDAGQREFEGSKNGLSGVAKKKRKRIPKQNKTM